MRVYSKNIIVRCIVSNELRTYFITKKKLKSYGIISFYENKDQSTCDRTIDRIEYCLCFRTGRGKFSNVSEQSVTNTQLAMLLIGREVFLAFKDI